MLLVLLIMLALLLLLFFYLRNEVEKKKLIFVGTRGLDNALTAEVERYGTYGVWLRLEGALTLPEGKSIDRLSLEGQKAYETKEEAKDYSRFRTAFSFPIEAREDKETLFFTTADEINAGVSMEALPGNGDYVLALKAKFSDGESAFYTLTDAGECLPISYYTLTFEGENSHLSLGFDEEETVPYLSLLGEPDTLPAEVYDIVLDAGHGGRDTGAVAEGLTEAELTLSYAKEVKALLEEEGYKVFLTRDGSEDKDADLAFAMYDEDGRVNTACRSRAKLALSIHFNSLEEASVSGTEVYCSALGNTDTAALLADSIVSRTGASYSTKKSQRRRDGVYSRTYTSEELPAGGGTELRNENTDYYFMIRELGGIWTHAYVDGSSEKYGENLFRNDNAGLESCLLEIGYLSNPEERQRLVGDREAYARAIAEGVVLWHTTFLDKQDTVVIK